MLYYEDYMELIEHLPDELRDRLTDIRELDLQVNNSVDRLDEQVRKFFDSIKDLDDEERKKEAYNRLLGEYLETLGYADEKIKMSEQIGDIFQRLIKHLDDELEKFKLELEADNAGITEALEARSLELDHQQQTEHQVINHRYREPVAKKLMHRRFSFQSTPSKSSKINPQQLHQTNEHQDDLIAQQQLKQTVVRKEEHDRLSIQVNENARIDSGGNGYQSSIHNYFSNSADTSSNMKKNDQSTTNKKSDSSKTGVKRRISSANAQSIKNDIVQSSLDNYGFHYRVATKDINNKPPHMNVKKSTYSNPEQQLNQSNLIIGQAGQLDLMKSKNSLDLFVKTSQQQNPSLQHVPIESPTHSPSYRNNNLNGKFPLAYGSSNFNGGPFSPSIVGDETCSPASLSPIGVVNSYLSNSEDSISRSNMTNNNNSSIYNEQITKSGRKTKRPKQMNFYDQDESLNNRHHLNHWSASNYFDDNNHHQHRESMPNTDLSEADSTFGSPSSSPHSPDFSSSAEAAATAASIYQRDDNKYCICRQVSYGEMVACDNLQCEYEWFHYDCVGITQPPKGKWFCPDCSKKMGQNNGSNGNGITGTNQNKKRGRKIQQANEKNSSNKQPQLKSIVMPMDIQMESSDSTINVNNNFSTLHQQKMSTAIDI